MTVTTGDLLAETVEGTGGQKRSAERISQDDDLVKEFERISYQTDHRSTSNRRNDNKGDN